MSFVICCSIHLHFFPIFIFYTSVSFVFVSFVFVQQSVSHLSQIPAVCTDSRSMKLVLVYMFWIQSLLVTSLILQSKSTKRANKGPLKVSYRALRWGVRKTVPSAVMSMTQCSAWMPIPHSWMSWESAEPTLVWSWRTKLEMVKLVYNWVRKAHTAVPGIKQTFFLFVLVTYFV